MQSFLGGEWFDCLANMQHTNHENHTHQHSGNCGHTRIKHGDHFDYLHDGCLHAMHESLYDECVLPISERDPAEC